MTDEPKRRGRPAGSKNKPKDGAAAETPKASAAPKAPKRETRRPSEGKTTEAKTHFKDLSDDQQFGLMMQHSRKIGEAEGKLEIAKKAVKGARDLARAEIGKDALHRIRLYNDLQTDAGQARLREQMDMTMQVATWAGMPTKQGDLFESVDRTPVDDIAFADGKRAGLAGENATPPDRFNSGVRQQKWLAGHAEGQAVLSKGFKPLKATAASDDEINWHALGAKAFVEKRNDIAPDDVPAEFRGDWQEGFRRAREASEKRMAVTDYAAQGRLHRRNGGGCSIPDAVPEDQRKAWHDAWLAEDNAMHPKSASAN